MFPPLKSRSLYSAIIFISNFVLALPWWSSFYHHDKCLSPDGKCSHITRRRPLCAILSSIMQHPPLTFPPSPPPCRYNLWCSSLKTGRRRGDSNNCLEIIWNQSFPGSRNSNSNIGNKLFNNKMSKLGKIFLKSFKLMQSKWEKNGQGIRHSGPHFKTELVEK